MPVWFCTMISVHLFLFVWDQTMTFKPFLVWKGVLKPINECFLTWHQHKVSTSCVWQEERSVQHFPALTSSIWLWHRVPTFTECWCHPHPAVFHGCEGLGAARTEGQCVGPEWDQACVNLGLWCSTEGSALSQRSLSIRAGTLWLSWRLVIDAFCLSTIVFYFIDLVTILNRWGIPKIPFSNVLPQEVGSLKCNNFWDAGAQKPPLSFVSELYSSLSEQVFRRLGFYSLQCQ